MEQKFKLILVALAGALLVFVSLFFQASSQNQRLTREKDELQKQSDSLTAQVSSLNSRVREKENEVSVLRRDVDKVNAEKSDIERRFDQVNKERMALAEKLIAAQKQATSVEQQAYNQGSSAPMNDAYWAQIVKAKTDMEMQLASIRTEFKNLQISNEQLLREKSNLELDLKNVSREKEDLKRQFDYNQKLMDSIAQDLVRERNDKMQINDSFKTLKNENMVLTRQLKTLNGRKVALEQKLAEMQNEKSSIEERVNGIENMLTDKIAQVEKLKNELTSLQNAPEATIAQAAAKVNQAGSAVELPPIVVRPRSDDKAPVNDVSVAAAVSAGLGKIIAVNRENNFVIIDLGEDSGVRSGDKLQVYRSGERVGNVEVVKASRNVSACDIKKEITPIKIGDIIR